MTHYQYTTTPLPIINKVINHQGFGTSHPAVEIYHNRQPSENLPEIMYRLSPVRAHKQWDH